MNKVTIIIPCFNYGHFLPETLNSVIAQSYTNWECIIIDDGSTDNTAIISKTYTERDSRFRYYYTENKGLSAARNHGIELASGDYIQFLDADDLLEENKIKVQHKFFFENQDVDIVYGSMIRFDSDTKEEIGNDSWMPKVSGQGTSIISYLIKGNIMVVSAPLIKKKVFEKTGTFNTEYKSMEDWEFWIRCALKNIRFDYLEAQNSRTKIRSHKSNMMLNNETMRLSSFKLRQELNYKLIDPNHKHLNRQILNQNYGEYGIDMILQGKSKKGIHYILKINRFCIFYYTFNALKLMIKKLLR